MERKITPRVRRRLHEEFEPFLRKERQKRKLFIHLVKIFNALNLTDFHQVKAVIVGQDPYHGKGQANGLSFPLRASQSHLHSGIF